MKFLSKDGCDYVNIVKAIINEDNLCVHTFSEDTGVGNLAILHKTKAEGLAKFILECLSENKGYQSRVFRSEDGRDYINISRSVLANKESFYINSFEEYVFDSNTVILQDAEAEKLARFILEEISKKK